MEKKKRCLKKWVKNIIAILLIVLSGIMLAHLICAKNEKYEGFEQDCDSYFNRTCTYHEVRQFMNGR